MATLNNEMQQALKLQENYAKKVCDEINTLPEGSLCCSIQGPYKYYYHSTFKDGIRQKEYISNKKGNQAHLISALKRKRFLVGCKKVLDGNVVALRACLLKYEEFDPALISKRLAATYENIKGVQEPQVALDWQHAPYPRVEMYEERLKHETIGGLLVRSKSEALIAFALDLAHIPFHYEEMLDLDNKKIAPDFTIQHPATGERVFWEHFGMMDDAAYATEAFKKLMAYGQNGIMPGKNLIFTMETNADPLSIRAIQCLIAQYFSS